MRRSLAMQMLVATALLAAIIAAAFFLMVRAVRQQSSAADAGARAEKAISIAADLERAVAALDAGARDYLIAGDRALLTPYTEAERSYPFLTRQLEEFAHGGIQRDAELTQVHEIEAQLASYVGDYLRPAVSLGMRDLAAARRQANPAEGRRRKVALRNLLATLVSGEKKEAAVAGDRADRRSDTAVAVGIAGGIGSVLLIAGYGLYLRRAVLRPAWRVADVSERIGAGDLSARALGARPDGNELQRMKHSFNEMAESVERNRDALLEADRDKDRFLGVLAEEISAPATAMIEQIDELVTRSGEEPAGVESRRSLRAMKRDAERLLKMVDDVLLVAHTGEPPASYRRDS